MRSAALAAALLGRVALAVVVACVVTMLVQWCMWLVL